MKTAIKKILYKEKPIAVAVETTVNFKTYQATTDGCIITFIIPIDEVTDSFTEEMESQLLIRWIDRIDC